MLVVVLAFHGQVWNISLHAYHHPHRHHHHPINPPSSPWWKYHAVHVFARPATPLPPHTALSRPLCPCFDNSLG